MRLFTMQQTESWQDEMLRAYGKAGALHDICWFVQMIFPPPTKAEARRMTQQERQEHRYRTASWPGNWVPIVPVAPCPETSRAEIEILVTLMVCVDPTVRLSPALGLVSDLTTLKHYEFGSEWDCICSQCGAVFRWTVPDVDICGECG